MSQPTLARCAVHPLRLSVDSCPVCARPRCAADAASAPGGGCVACGGTPPGPTRVPPGRIEQGVRAALASTAAALPGGFVAAEYVQAPYFEYLTPFLVGLITGAAAQAASGGPRVGPAAQLIRALACVYAVVGTAYGFALEGSQGVFEIRSLLPYGAAVLGVLLWTTPPKGARQRAAKGPQKATGRRARIRGGRRG